MRLLSFRIGSDFEASGTGRTRARRLDASSGARRVPVGRESVHQPYATRMTVSSPSARLCELVSPQRLRHPIPGSCGGSYRLHVETPVSSTRDSWSSRGTSIPGSRSIRLLVANPRLGDGGFGGPRW